MVVKKNYTVLVVGSDGADGVGGQSSSSGAPVEVLVEESHDGGGQQETEQGLTFRSTSEEVQELVEQLASAERLLDAARAEGRELENRLGAVVGQRNELQEEQDDFKLLAEQRGMAEDRPQKQVGDLEEEL